MMMMMIMVFYSLLDERKKKLGTSVRNVQTSKVEKQFSLEG